jgi:acylglycerol lipase
MIATKRRRSEPKEESVVTTSAIASHSDQEEPSDFKVSQQWTKAPSGIDCIIHEWVPCIKEPAVGVVVIFHGLGGHGFFPSVRYLAEILVGEGFIVNVMDFAGHGQSCGLKGYIKSPEILLEDAIHAVKHAKTESPDLPLFFAGASMGGAVALLVSLQVKQVSGLILLAPMVSLYVSQLQRWALQQLAAWAPKMGLSKAHIRKAIEYQFRDPVAKEEVLQDPLLYHGRLRAASAKTCVALTDMLRESLHEIRAPLLCLLAEEDYMIDNTGIDDLMREACSPDKTLKEYDALHGLMCEVEPLKSKIRDDIVSWLNQRI